MKREETRHISAFLKDFVKDNNLEEGLLQCRVFDAWDKVLGEVTRGIYPPGEAARLTSRRFFKDGTLTLKMTSSMVRMQLKMDSEVLLRRINDFLGEQVVTRLTFS